MQRAQRNKCDVHIKNTLNRRLTCAESTAAKTRSGPLLYQGMHQTNSLNMIIVLI